MKLLTLQAFVELPSPVLYQTYQPCFFGPLTLRYDVSQYGSGPYSWVARALGVGCETPDQASDFTEDRPRAIHPDLTGREYPGKEVGYLVYEPEDLERLTALMRGTLEVDTETHVYVPW